MDKKTKKRLEVLRKKVAQLQQQLAGATQQMDDPAEAERIQQALNAAKAEMAELKGNG